MKVFIQFKDGWAMFDSRERLISQERLIASAIAGNASAVRRFISPRIGDVLKQAVTQCLIEETEAVLFVDENNLINYGTAQQYWEGRTIG